MPTLSPEQRQQALVLHRALLRVVEAAAAGEKDATKLIAIGKGMIAEEKAARLDYFAIVDPDSLEPVRTVERGALVAVAAYIGTTRLIDNVVLGAASGSSGLLR